MTQPRVKRQNLLCPACGVHTAKDIPSLVKHLQGHHHDKIPGGKYHLGGGYGEPICGTHIVLPSSHVVSGFQFMKYREAGLPICKRCDKRAVLIKASIDRIDKAMEGKVLPDATCAQLELSL